MTNEEKWRDKVEKILKMAEDPAVDEKARQNYVDRATEIMIKYGIEEAMLDLSENKPITVTSIDLMAKNPYQLKKRVLCHNIFKVFNCYTVFTQKSIMRCYGNPDDLDRAKTLYNSLLVQMFIGLSNAQDFKPDYVHGKAYNSSWINGFVDTVIERAKESLNLVKNDVSNGGSGMELALVNREKASIEAAHADFSKLVHGTSSLYASSNSAYRAGQAAGRQADLGQTRLGSRRALPGR